MKLNSWLDYLSALLVIAVLIVSGAFIQRDAKRAGYAKLEKDLVYAIASSYRSGQTVGIFSISRMIDGSVTIEVNSTWQIAGAGGNDGRVIEGRKK